MKHHRNSDTKTANRDHIRTTALERSVMNYRGLKLVLLVYNVISLAFRTLLLRPFLHSSGSLCEHPRSVRHHFPRVGDFKRNRVPGADHVQSQLMEGEVKECSILNEHYILLLTRGQRISLVLIFIQSFHIAPRCKFLMVADVSTHEVRCSLRRTRTL